MSLPDTPASESVTSTPTVTATKKRRFGVIDLIITLVILAAIVFLARALMTQLSLRTNINGAMHVSDMVISDIQMQNAAEARKLGDTRFQAVHTDQQLAGLFEQAKPYVSGTPTVVKRTLDSGKAAKVASIYYKFDAKKPFYVRVTVSKLNGSKDWHLINFSGNSSLATLTK